MSDLSHIEKGRAKMVDVSAKPETVRTAVAAGRIDLAPQTMDLIAAGRAAKGPVLETARIAGISAAKKTSELIPLCHPLRLSKIDVEFEADEAGYRIIATVVALERTGVEMEALTAASVAALTVYDMVKAVDRAAVIGNIRLLHKSGGKSGEFNRQEG